MILRDKIKQACAKYGIMLRFLSTGDGITGCRIDEIDVYPTSSIEDIAKLVETRIEKYGEVLLLKRELRDEQAA